MIAQFDRFNQSGLIDLLAITPSQLKQLEIAIRRYAKLLTPATPQERRDNDILLAKLGTATNRAGKMINKGLTNE
jgi:hypothetical protein